MILKKVIRSCKHPFSRRSYRGSRHLQLLCFLVCQMSAAGHPSLGSAVVWYLFWALENDLLEAFIQSSECHWEACIAPWKSWIRWAVPSQRSEHWLFKKPQEALRGPRSAKQSFPQRFEASHYLQDLLREPRHQTAVSPQGSEYQPCGAHHSPEIHVPLHWSWLQLHSSAFSEVPGSGNIHIFLFVLQALWVAAASKG